MAAALEAVYRLLDTNLLSVGGLVALCVIVVIGEVGFATPVLLEGIFLTAGIHLSQGRADLLPLFGVTISASILGASLVYSAGGALHGPIAWLTKMAPWSSREQLESLQGRIAGASLAMVATLRLLPAMLVPVSLASGLFKLPWGTFALGVALSDLVWNSTFLALGLILGKAFPKEEAVSAFWWGVGIAAALMLTVALATNLRRWTGRLL